MLNAASSGSADSAVPLPQRPRISATSGPRRLTIGSFKIKPRLPETFEAETWEKLRGAVCAIQQRRPVPDSLEELYKACENLCHHNKQSSTYDRLRDVCKEHVLSELASVKASVSSGDPSGALRAIDDCWRNYCQQMLLIRSIFLYLDRTYVLQTQNLKSIWTMSMDFFRDHIVEDPLIQRRAVEGVLAEIDRERRGDQISRPLLRSVLRMMVDLNVYIRIFEKPFLDATRNFYQQWSKAMVSTIEGSASNSAAPSTNSVSSSGNIAVVVQVSANGNLSGNSAAAGTNAANNAPSGAEGVSNYLARVLDRLAQENGRCSAGEGYLDVITRKKLVQVLEAELVHAHAITLLDIGFDRLLEDNRLVDLSRIYMLLDRIGMLDELRHRLSEYIKRTGVVIVKDSSRDKTMVSDLLAFKLKIDTILHDAFANAPSFDHAIKEAFENFINQRQNKPAEMIAKHVDELLKRVKGLTEVEIDKQLDQCLSLFRFIQGKDIFEAFYSKDLAKRLLLGKSASVDAEKSMLVKLKTECGPGFTSKLEGMFKDMDLSRDIQRSFEAMAGIKEKLGSIDLTVNVLTSGFWPTYPIVELNLPKELSVCQDVFRDFYLSKHSGRRLMWQNALGYCLLRSQFSKQPKELHVSLFQTVVLLCFNDRSTCTYQELRNFTGLEDKELVRTLQSLSLGKIRVLTKSNKGKDISQRDVFDVNDALVHPQFRIKINSIQVKETTEEQEETTERVFQDRVFQVDAAIVRIMKTEKKVPHNVLSSKLFNIVKFPIPAEELKKRIESLIEREYLERDPSDHTQYLYVA